jgi:hypothetical protein
MSEQDTKKLFKTRTLMVAVIELGVDNSVERNLKELAKIQAQDKRIRKIIRILEQEHPNVSEREYDGKNGILYNKDNNKYPYLRPVLSTELEIPVIQYVHTTLGHLDTDKCVAQIANTFHVKGLGRKVRTFISRCDTCQRVKHPNRELCSAEFESFA